MTADTSRVSAYFDGPDGAAAAVDFVADIGGDGSDYGVEDPRDWTPATLAQALEAYLAGLAEMGVLDPATAAACRSGNVDWPTVLRHVDTSFSGGMSGP